MHERRPLRSPETDYNFLGGACYLHTDGVSSLRKHNELLSEKKKNKTVPPLHVFVLINFLVPPLLPLTSNKGEGGIKNNNPNNKTTGLNREQLLQLITAACVVSAKEEIGFDEQTESSVRSDKIPLVTITFHWFSRFPL